jgi:hypothetical protein
MQAYEISPNEQVEPTYVGTTKDVRDCIRLMPKDSRAYARIALVDLPADKAAFLILLNKRPDALSQWKQTLRKWRLSVRGRLIEIDVETEADLNQED